MLITSAFWITTSHCHGNYVYQSAIYIHHRTLHAFNTFDKNTTTGSHLVNALVIIPPTEEVCWSEQTVGKSG